VIEGRVVSYIRTDHIGRPVFATNAAGVKVWTAGYDPFGGVRTTTGTPTRWGWLAGRVSIGQPPGVQRCIRTRQFCG
jgi:hypothetical protein